jgi:hypothetical protein
MTAVIFQQLTQFLISVASHSDLAHGLILDRLDGCPTASAEVSYLLVGSSLAIAQGEG